MRWNFDPLLIIESQEAMNWNFGVMTCTVFFYGEMFARQTHYTVQLGIIEEIKVADCPHPCFNPFSPVYIITPVMQSKLVRQSQIVQSAIDSSGTIVP